AREGPGAVGVQDRQDRLAGAGGAVVSGSRAGDLAADAGAASGAGALPLAAASGQASLDLEDADPFDADRVRASGPDVGPVRCRRPQAVGRARYPGAVARARR